MRGRRLLIVLVVLVILALGTYVAARRILGSDLVRRTLERQLSAVFNQPVHVASASAAIFPHIALNLGDVTIGDPVAVQIREIRIATGLRSLWSRVVEDAEVRMSEGTVLLPLKFDLPPRSELPPEGGSHQRVAKGQSGAASPTALTVASVRAIGVRSVSFIAGKQTFLVDADSSLRGDRLEISNLSARAQTTRIEASGVLESVAALSGQFEAKANPLDLDELITFAAAATATTATKTAPRRPAAEMSLRIALAAPNGRFAQTSFRDLSTTLEIVPVHIRLVPLGVSTFAGRFEGRLDADTARDPPDLRLTGRVDGLDVVELLKASGSPGGITGRLGGSVSLSGSGTDSDTLMRSARGTITAVITDGSMPHLEMVRTIVLAFGKPSGAPPLGSGSAFSRLGGTFSLANGTMASNDISMNSRDFDLAGSGTLHLATGAVSARGDVVLSQELTSQAGVDLRRYAQQDGRVIIPATVSGTLQRPQVSLDLLAAARRALGNELQRRVKSLLDDLFKKKK